MSTFLTQIIHLKSMPVSCAEHSYESKKAVEGEALLPESKSDSIWLVCRAVRQWNRFMLGEFGLLLVSEIVCLILRSYSLTCVIGQKLWESAVQAQVSICAVPQQHCKVLHWSPAPF